MKYHKEVNMSDLIYEFVMGLKAGWFWFLAIALIFGGFVMLIKGADVFVSAASNLAKRIKIPAIVVGLTIVAFGTSAPELSVSAAAAISGSAGISVGNIVGSNIFNLLVILGLSAALKPFAINKMVVKRDVSFMLGSVFLLLAFTLLFGNSLGRTLLWFEGLVMLVIFIAYVVLMIRYEIRHQPVQKVEVQQKTEEKKINLPITLLFLVLSLAIIIVGGNLVNAGAKGVAVKIGVSETLAGLTICAFGASLPELITSIIAIRKNECEIVIGNVVGSNIFNVMLILGICSVISPLAIDLFSVIDIVIMVVLFVAFFIYCLLSKNVDRKAGITMVVLYAAYLTFIVLREYFWF